jgi:hypothetical protein
MSYRSTAYLLALLALVGAIVYFVELRNPPATSGSAPKKELQITSLKAADVETIEVKQGDRSVVVKKGDDGKWMIDQPEKLEAEQSQVGAVASQLAALQAERVIADKPDNLADFGLDKPQWEVNIGVKGGEAQSLLVGGDNPNSSGIYLKRADTDTVYLVSSYTMTDLKNWLTTPPKAVPTPTPMPVATETPSPETSSTPSATSAVPAPAAAPTP